MVENGHPRKIVMEIRARRDGSGNSLVIRHYDAKGKQMFGGSYFCALETTSKYPYGFDAVLKDHSRKVEFYYYPDSNSWKGRGNGNGRESKGS